MTSQDYDTDDPEVAIDSMGSAISSVSFTHILLHTDHSISVSLDGPSSLPKLRRGLHKVLASPKSTGTDDPASPRKGRFCIHFDSIARSWKAYPAARNHSHGCPLQQQLLQDAQSISQDTPSLGLPKGSDRECCTIGSAESGWRAMLRFGDADGEVVTMGEGRPAAGIVFHCRGDGLLKRIPIVQCQGKRFFHLGAPEHIDVGLNSASGSSSVLHLSISGFTTLYVKNKQDTDESGSSRPWTPGLDKEPGTDWMADTNMGRKRASSLLDMKGDPESRQRLTLVVHKMELEQRLTLDKSACSDDDKDKEECGAPTEKAVLADTQAAVPHDRYNILPLATMGLNTSNFQSPLHPNLQAQSRSMTNVGYPSVNVPPQFLQHPELDTALTENHLPVSPLTPSSSPPNTSTAVAEPKHRFERTVSANHATFHSHRSTAWRSQRRAKPSVLFRSYSTADLGTAKEAESKARDYNLEGDNINAPKENGKHLHKTVIRFLDRPFNTVRMHEPEKGHRRPQLRRNVTDENHGSKARLRNRSPAPPLTRVDSNLGAKGPSRPRSPAPPPLLQKRSVTYFGKKIAVPSQMDTNHKLSGASLLTRSLLEAQLKADEEEEARREMEEQGNMEEESYGNDDDDEDDEDKPIISPPGSYMSSPPAWLSGPESVGSMKYLPSLGGTSSHSLQNHNIEQEIFDQRERRTRYVPPAQDDQANTPRNQAANGERVLPLDEIAYMEAFIEETYFRSRVGGVKNWFRWPPQQVSAEFLPRNLQWMDWRLGPNGDQWTRNMSRQAEHTSSF